MPAAAVAVLTYVGAETVGAYVVSAIAADVVVSSAVATAVGAATISATATALQGGSATEALKSAVTGGVGAYIGSYVGNVVGAEVGAASGSPVAKAIATNVTKNVTTAAILGRDLETAALTGLAAGVPMMLGSMDSFKELPDFAKAAVSNATVAAVTGKDVNTALVASALQSANILGTAINSNDKTREFFSDPANKAATTLVSNVFNTGVSAAIQGRDVPKALESSLAKSLTQMVGSEASQGLKEYAKQAQEAYKTAQAKESEIQAASARENEAVTAFNTINEPLREKYDQQKSLVEDYEAKKAEWQAMVDKGDVAGANAFVGQVNDAAKAATVAIDDVNKYYTDNKEAIDKARADYEATNKEVLALKGGYDESLANLAESSSALDTQLSEFQKYVNAETAKVVDPYETTMEEAKAFAAKYNLDDSQLDKLSMLTTGFTPETSAIATLAEYKQSLGGADPEFASAADRAYQFAISQGKTSDEANAFAEEYARTTLGREAETGEKPVFTGEITTPILAGEPGSEDFVPLPGTRLASLDEVMADQESGAGKTFYDANANAWVSTVAPDVEGLDLSGKVGLSQLADFQGMDGIYRVPNADGSYHMYNQYGVYQGVYTGDDAFVSYRPESSPIDVEVDLTQATDTGEEFVDGSPTAVVAENVPGPLAKIPTFKMVNVPPDSSAFTSPAPKSSVSPSATSPSASASPLKKASETAQGSTLGKMPGSWVGGLGRPVSFIDPLSATDPTIGQEESADMYSTSPLAAAVAQPSEQEMSLQPETNYYSYGYEPSFSSIMQPYKNPSTPPTMYASGGEVMTSPLMAAQGGDVPHKGSHYVQGAGGGQDDLIDAKLADGEYVLDAEIVAALGDGSNKRGAEILDKWRQNIRKHKRSASVDGIPPKAKSPLEYMKGIK